MQRVLVTTDLPSWAVPPPPLPRASFFDRQQQARQQSARQLDGSSRPPLPPVADVDEDAAMSQWVAQQRVKRASNAASQLTAADKLAERSKPATGRVECGGTAPTGATTFSSPASTRKQQQAAAQPTRPPSPTAVLL